MKNSYYALTILATQVTDNVAQTAPQTDIVGIGGIFATVLCCILTCVVTWILTMKSMKQLKLSYSIQVIPILPDRISGVDELTIFYKQVVLKQPCILNLDIRNIGNTAVENCNIEIKTSENLEIIPGYIHNISPGYEDKWKLEEIDSISSKIHLDYINPNQVVNVRFFLTDIPKTKFVFACPMPNLQIQEIKSKQESSSALGRFNALEKAAIVLSGIFVLLVATFESWYYMLYDVIRRTELKYFLIPQQLTAFVMVFLLLSIVVCFTRIPFIDKVIVKANGVAVFAELGFILISFAGLFLIIFNLVFQGIGQILVGILALILLVLSLYIHLVRKVYR